MNLLKELLSEKWTTTIIPQRVKNKDFSKSSSVLTDLKSELSLLKKAGPHHRGSAEYGRMKELMRAIETKTMKSRGRVNESKKVVTRLNEDHFKVGEKVKDLDGYAYKVDRIKKKANGEEVYVVKCLKTNKLYNKSPAKLKKMK